MRPRLTHENLKKNIFTKTNYKKTNFESKTQIELGGLGYDLIF